ncbi:MAG TPA: hypothetical protein VLW44_08480 [Streptosporangiaceae bacterium]|nr:hypothetical protein [Streptosporangiaceae bacterium]HUL25796.1 hypothetical protein [Streptosporangiaceae bacterium]
MDEIDEAELISAAQRGSVLDAAAAGAKRAVPAALVRRCCHELKDQVDPRGLRLASAVVTGRLDLAGLAVPFPLRFDGCEFEAAPVVEGAELFELSLTGCPRLPGLLGNGLRLRRDLDLSRSQVAGAHWTSASTSKQAAIWLCESEIGGRLLCVDATIDGQGDRSIQADRARFGGAVRLLHQFSSRGEIRLIGARLGGSLDLTGAQIESSDGPAIDLADAIIEGSVFLIEDPGGRRPVIRGRVGLGSARISGRFLIRNATLEARTDLPTGSIYAMPAMIGTAMSADRLSVGADVTLAGTCEVTGRIDMTMADVSSLSVGGNCVLRAPGRTALELTNAEIRANFRLEEGASVEGTIRMAGAVIHGTLALQGEVSHPEHGSLVGGSAMRVDGDIYLDGLRTAGGRVNFRGATLGSLTASGARLDNPGGYALRLSQTVIKGSVLLIDGFTSTGLVALNRSTIDGRLQFTGGSFSCPEPVPANEHGHAIEAISTTVRGGIDLGWKTVSPSVDFTDAVTTFLADDPATWPERFTIAGLTYERFEKPQGAAPKRIWDQAARCAWLSRQTEFESGPYEQAARVFRQHGYTREAERVLIAQRRHARQVGHSGSGWPQRAIEAVYATIGYGYRPSRVLWLLAALLILVTFSLVLPVGQHAMRATNGNGAVYVTGQPATSADAAAPGPAASGSAPPARSCGDGEVRCFSPVLYAIDTVVPLISLDQRTTWYPDPDAPGGQFMLWWLNLATLLGWLLSSIFVLSLARLSRSS